jgi:hypothetical protein
MSGVKIETKNVVGIDLTRDDAAYMMYMKVPLLGTPLLTEEEDRTALLKRENRAERNRSRTKAQTGMPTYEPITLVPLGLTPETITHYWDSIKKKNIKVKRLTDDKKMNGKSLTEENDSVASDEPAAKKSKTTE